MRKPIDALKEGVFGKRKLSPAAQKLAGLEIKIDPDGPLRISLQDLVQRSMKDGKFDLVLFNDQLRPTLAQIDAHKAVQVRQGVRHMTRREALGLIAKATVAGAATAASYTLYKNAQAGAEAAEEAASARLAEYKEFMAVVYGKEGELLSMTQKAFEEFVHLTDAIFTLDTISDIAKETFAALKEYAVNVVTKGDFKPDEFEKALENLKAQHPELANAMHRLYEAFVDMRKKIEEIIDLFSDPKYKDLLDFKAQTDKFLEDFKKHFKEAMKNTIAPSIPDMIGN